MYTISSPVSALCKWEGPELERGLLPGSILSELAASDDARGFVRDGDESAGETVEEVA